MTTQNLIAFGIVAVIVGAAIYIATRPTPADQAAALAASNPAGVPEGAAYITAGGNAIASVLGGIGSLYSVGRQAGGTSAGATK